MTRSISTTSPKFEFELPPKSIKKPGTEPGLKKGYALRKIFKFFARFARKKI